MTRRLPLTLVAIFAAWTFGLGGGAVAQPLYVIGLPCASEVGPTPVWGKCLLPDQPWFSAVQQSSALASVGQVNTGTYHWSPNSSVAGAVAQAIYQIDDLVFGSPAGVTSTTVWFNAPIFGSLDGDPALGGWVAGVSVHVSIAGGQSSGSVSYTNNGLNAESGVLVGYPMRGEKSLKFGPFIVSTNVPVTLQMKIDASASSSVFGQVLSLQQLGIVPSAFTAPDGTSPTRTNVFDLEPGITATSPGTGIFDNQFYPPDELFLDADKTTVAANQEFALYTFNGEPGALVGLLVTEVNGTPVFTFTGAISVIDGFGGWDLGPIAHIPALSGFAFGLTTATKSPAAGLTLSNQLVVTFQ